MKKIILIAIIFIAAFTKGQAQIIYKNYMKHFGQAIKEGYQEIKGAIIQDTKPLGEHNVWDLYAAPRIGFNVSNIFGNQSNPKLGIVAGAYTEVFITKNLAINIEAQYSYQGATGLTEQKVITDASGETTIQEDGPYNINIHSFNTNYLVRWYPWENIPCSFVTGLHTGSILKANAKKKNGETLNIKKDIYLNDIAIPMGISYEWKQWQIETRYNLFLKKIAKNNNRPFLKNAQKNMIEVTLGYRIQVL